MYSFFKNFNINLSKYDDNKIIISVENIKINTNIKLEEIIKPLTDYYPEVTIDFHNFNNKIPNKNFLVIITITDNHSNLNIINPDYNHLYYLDSYTTKITNNLLLKYNTLALCIVGLFIKEILLKDYNIIFFTHLNAIGNTFDSVANYNKLQKELFKFKNDRLPIVDARAKIIMEKIINKTINEKKVISGSLETIIYNLPKGLGKSYFNLFEGSLAKILYSIPELKGLEFADIFRINNSFIQPYKNISFVNDTLSYDSNINYGIEQGVSNGEYVIFKTHFIPPLIYTNNSKSINYETLENVLIKPIKQEYFNLFKYIFQVEALSAIVIYDQILTK